MKEILTWISARQLISDFIDWAKAAKGESFSYEIFRRAKVSAPPDLTDRQILLCELATEFVAIESEKRQPETSQMSEAWWDVAWPNVAGRDSSFQRECPGIQNAGTYREVEQLVARQAHNLEVRGSSPFFATTASQYVACGTEQGRYSFRSFGLLGYIRRLLRNAGASATQNHHQTRIFSWDFIRETGAPAHVAGASFPRKKNPSPRQRKRIGTINYQ